MAPAIRLASEGFVLTDQEAAELHDPVLTQFPASRKIFQRDGDFYKSGDTFRQPELAETLRRIANKPEDFYEGAMARQIADAIHQGGGLITANDLARYTVKERKPVMGTYHGYSIVSAPPPSSGGIALIEMLNMLDHYDLHALGDRTTPEVHLILEAFRRAYMDRTGYLGDPDYVHIPVEKLLSRKYADAFRASINPDKATPSADLQRPAGFLPRRPLWPMSGRNPSIPPTTPSWIPMATPSPSPLLSTTLLDPASPSPASVSFSTTRWTTSPPSRACPTCLALSRARQFHRPRQAPAVQHDPHYRPCDGKVAYVLGTPGGATIITTVANIFISVADQGLNIQQAVDAPRFHHQYLPDTVMLERGFSDATLNGLRAMGYTLRIGRHWGDGECIAVDPRTGELSGGQDHRHNYGEAAGY